MAIEVRIPTILRNYTDGAKTVDGSGGTLEELFADLEGRHPGLRERLVDEKGLRRFVNVYLNDEDVRFLSGLETALSDGDTVTVLPAVAGGAAGVFAGAGVVEENGLRLSRAAQL
jgi:sulfur-carrier protein